MELLVILALTSVVAARNLDPLTEESVYGYSVKYGIPLADKVRKYEESQSRIVGGTPSVLGQFPYQAGIIIEYTNRPNVALCGASLITANRLTTAAHCWYDGFNQALQLTVVLGSTTVFAGGTRIVTRNVVTHPGWNVQVSRLLNDVAVIYLPSPVTFSSIIAPIALPSGNELNQDFAGATVTASGFGLTQDGGSIAANQFLSHVTLNVISNTECRSVYGSAIQDSILCTRGPVGHNICTSDSGGPLATISNNRPVLIGIVGFGSDRGCEIAMPSGYARVTSFMDFINENL